MLRNLCSSWTIAAREVLAIVQSKAFWFFAIVYPILIGTPFLLGGLNSNIGDVLKKEAEDSAWRYEYFSSQDKKMIQERLWGDPVKFSIVDQTGYLYKHIRYEIVAEFLQEQFWMDETIADIHRWEQEGSRLLPEHYTRSPNLFEEILPIDDSVETIHNWLEEKRDDSVETIHNWLEEKRIEGYFIIPQGFLATNDEVRFYRTEGVSLRLGNKIEKLKAWFQNIVARAIKKYRLETANIDPTQRQELLRGVDISIVRVRRSVPPASTEESALSLPFEDTNLYQMVSVGFVVSFWELHT